MENIKQTPVLEKNPRWPRKRFLFVVFLCFILGTPGNIALASSFLQRWDGNIALLITAVGAIGSGFTLAKMFAKKTATVWILGVCFRFW